MKRLLLVPILLAGCAATVTHLGKRPDFSKIEMGMSQQQVIEVLGAPEDMAAKDGTVYLNYSYAPWFDHDGLDGYKELYFVRLIDGKVDAFGKRGDFDTTKDPTVNVNIRND